MGIGALANLGISKGMSLGRELFGFLLRSDLNVAKIAEWAGITMDTLKDAGIDWDQKGQAFVFNSTKEQESARKALGLN